ncbi:anaerobic dimethyl sulfoxide reductase subunit A [Desulfatibacillum alkenivorans DSM 16219]|uniref:Anaerobic dimethyl sulfoxide reductase subunit A n=1 Tax=Desulfatibacillum alkenivorans DSM 16219 TaxID=1121393 RepID=A0A1M6MRS1_9BACT|nr:molybdopterin-dependent oxidoreductase [Desulfatibacillum alkenivorans]SHJ86080.1 anaerobic dimethyl sulfoxide reductase subunit A [Desulfatibacillum alkenivorans DSM 16219]
MENPQHSQDVRIVRATSAFDCGGRCPLLLHVKDNKIIRIEGDDHPDSDRQLRTCLRCRAYRKYVHHPERLMHPQKRAGAKGEGKFERISWDEALSILSDKLKETKDKFGPESILLMTGGGYLASLHSGSMAAPRLLNQFGGYTTHYGNISSEGAVWASLVQYGSVMVGHSREDMLNSKLIILWGWDPARMISGSNTMHHLLKAKENGARVISVEPRYTDTAAAVADKWIPIYPGTDTAMMAAMAYVMITEDLHDQAFLDKYTIGFDKFKEYILGDEDGQAKTPQWAEAVCGVPAETIADLAREYAAAKPAALMDCQGPARSAMGEQYCRFAATLSAMTGNVGKPGGSACGGLMGIPIGHMFRMSAIPPGKNPVEMTGPKIKGTLDIRDRVIKRIHINKLWEAILEGKAGGFPADVKMAWSMCNNYLNQIGNANKGDKALKKLPFFAVNEIFMTAQARYADLLLPVTTAAERSDLTYAWPSGPYYTFVNRAIEPLGECKSDLEICEMLSDYLGVKDYRLGAKEDDILKHMVDQNPVTSKYVTDFDKFKNDGIHRIELKEPYIAFRKQIEDPENNPFDTPSGKIEIYSQRVADINSPKCPPVPKYIPTFEDRNDPLFEKYPLQLLTPHPRNRVHSEMYKVEWLREAEPHVLWIHPKDAEARGVSNGDDIQAFNDRGRVALKAFVTQRIKPGVVCMFEGAWYQPDENGIDRGACANTLTKDDYSGGGAAVMNTSLVQVAKA